MVAPLIFVRNKFNSNIIEISLNSRKPYSNAKTIPSINLNITLRIYITTTNIIYLHAVIFVSILISLYGV